jgi:hypothetical protein
MFNLKEEAVGEVVVEENQEEVMGVYLLVKEVKKGYCFNFCFGLYYIV